MERTAAKRRRTPPRVGADTPDALRAELARQGIDPDSVSGRWLLNLVIPPGTPERMT
jgi:hypothetical protein